MFKKKTPKKHKLNVNYKPHLLRPLYIFWNQILQAIEEKQTEFSERLKSKGKGIAELTYKF